MAAIVYDSVYGNTRQVAEAMAAALPGGRALDMQAARGLVLADGEALVLGSPTRGFSATPAMTEFIAGLRPADLEGRTVAVFDTRLAPEAIRLAPLRWIVDTGGYAAQRMAHALGHKGVVGEIAQEGFMVLDTEGPLKEGELERAARWVQGIAG